MGKLLCVKEQQPRIRELRERMMNKYNKKKTKMVKLYSVDVFVKKKELISHNTLKHTHTHIYS